MSSVYVYSFLGHFAITKYHRLCALNDRNLLSGGWKFKMKVSTGLALRDNLPQASP